MNELDGSEGWDRECCGRASESKLLESGHCGDFEKETGRKKKIREEKEDGAESTGCDGLTVWISARRP